MALTVSMPYYRSPDTVRRAVLSILRGSYTDLTLVVVNDSDDPDVWEPLDGIDDPRLVRFDLDGNHGRYFVDAVVAAAAETPWFTCHDSDDWSHRNRLNQMMRHTADVAVVPGAEQIHGINGAVRHRRPLTRVPRTSGPIPHMWHISALYRTDVFRRVIHPGYRVAWDSLMSAMLHAAPEVLIRPCNSVHYHRVGRADSLTRHPDTGINSDYRRAVVDELADMWRRYQQAPGLDTATDLIADSARHSTRYAVAWHAQRLRRLL